MATDRHAQKLVIAGASSLLGNELKSVLEESPFAAWDVRLVDEELRAGILTEAKGEATIIQAIDEDTNFAENVNQQILFARTAVTLKSITD